MPTPIKLSEDQLDWIADNHGLLAYAEMARTVGVCVDTLKRIMVREGIAGFEGAKFTPPPPAPEMWDRPCIRCKTKERRPKGFYLCSPCRRASGYTED